MGTINTSIEIWEEHKQKLKAFICRKMKHDDQCHDILHDVFLKITENAERIRWSVKPASYVIRMAQNAVVDHYRLQTKNSPAEMEEVVLTEEPFTSKLADCSLHSFIQQLPTVYRDAILYTDLEGRSQKDLAEKLKISYAGAKSRVQRARQMLKEAILECCNYQFDKYGNIMDCCE